MIPDNLSPAQAEAVDDLFHGYDLIGRQPHQSEIDDTVARFGGSS